MMNISNWKDYNKGEANCYSWKLERVQVKIKDNHYINNFVDYVIKNSSILYDMDKIILLGNGNPIALFPKNTDDLKHITVYLESIKNTDIHTIVISLGENAGMFVNSDLIEEVLSELNAQTKIEVRYILSE
jgi:hypothetical protein